MGKCHVDRILYCNYGKGRRVILSEYGDEVLRAVFPASNYTVALPLDASVSIRNCEKSLDVGIYFNCNHIGHFEVADMLTVRVAMTSYSVHEMVCLAEILPVVVKRRSLIPVLTLLMAWPPEGKIVKRPFSTG